MRLWTLWPREQGAPPEVNDMMKKGFLGTVETNPGVGR